MRVIDIKKTRQLWLCLVMLATLSSPLMASDYVSYFNRWSISGPTGGDVRTIVIDPKNKNHLFVSTLDGQVYASYDEGGSWKLLVNLNRPRLVLG